MQTSPKQARRAGQLPLFQPPRQEPSWESMPPEIQQQIERLLARMLREHVARSLGTTLAEDCHE